MKDILSEFYKINIDNYQIYKDGLIFQIDGINYYFTKTFYDSVYINELIRICNELKEQNIFLHDFVKNINNEYLTEQWILFRVNTLLDDIDLNDINKFININCNKYLSEYITMEDFWQNKIDYFEIQISELSDNKLINHSFDYYIGIAEIIIQFLRKNPAKIDLCLSHKTLDSLKTIDFYNPLNITFDLKLKDIASYIRLTNNLELLSDILDQQDEYYNKAYFMARMVFPFKYFNVISNMVVDKEKDSDLVYMLNNVKQYENYVSKIQSMFGIYLFSWIKKSN